MPDFTFNSPDGKQYTVSGPDGATKEQAFAQLQSGLKSGAIKADAAPASAPPAAAAEGPAPYEPGFGEQMGNFAKDAVAPIVRGAGTAYGAVKNLVTGEADDPRASGQAAVNAAQLSHPAYEPDNPIDAKEGIRRTLPKVGDIPAVKSAIESPAGRFATDVGGASMDVAGGVAAAAGLKGLGGAAADAADTGVNALNKPTGAQADTLASNPKIQQLRQSGFKVTGSDVRAAVNAPDSDIHGVTDSTPQSTDTIQRHNQAQATAGMTEEAGLGNTRAVDQAQIDMAKRQAGAVYQKIGDAIGTGRQPTPTLDADLEAAGPKAATPEAQTKIDKQIQFYRDHFNQVGFDGPDAVQMTRSLREDARTRFQSDDPDSRALGVANRGIANAVENEMMRQLPAQAQTLKDAFPAARQQLAKLNDLESVTEGGQVNAAKVLQLKKDGVPLSGSAMDIANAADVAPESMSRAGGTPATQLAPPTHTGLVRNVMSVGRGIVQKLPGLDPASDAYQEAHYGPVGKPPAVPEAAPAAPSFDLRAPAGNAAPPPAQGGLALGAPREQLELTHPEGEVPTSSRVPGQREIDLPPPGRAPLDLTHPEGPAPYEPAQRGMQLPQAADKTPPDNLRVGQGKPSKMTAAQRKAWEDDAAARLKGGS